MPDSARPSSRRKHSTGFATGERFVSNSEYGAEFFIGGVGGVYFLAEPGELVVEVEKRDRHQYDRRTELRAILAGPDRRVLQESTIPDDGKPRGSGLGSVQRCRISTRVERKGVYALNITVSQDRYGEEIVWKFRSNCRKYVVETARGHKDEAHQEPIVLASPGPPGRVCFLPRRGAFRIDLTDLPIGAQPPQVFDENGKPPALTVDERSRAHTRDVPRHGAPWRLHLPSASDGEHHA